MQLFFWNFHADGGSLTGQVHGILTVLLLRRDMKLWILHIRLDFAFQVVIHLCSSENNTRLDMVSMSNTLAPGVKL